MADSHRLPPPLGSCRCLTRQLAIFEAIPPMLPTVTLSLLQNGLHSLYHGVEHLHHAVLANEDPDIAAYDPRDGTVTRPNKDGSSSWTLVDYSRPPAIYGIKFAVLHLIQASELIVKAYLASDNLDAVRERPGSARTISMLAAVTRLAKERPRLLDPEHIDLMIKASELRNAMEHSTFSYDFERMKAISIDFLAISSYLASTLHGISIVDAFQYDPYSDGFDKTGAFLSFLLGERTNLSDEIVARHAAEWASKNNAERLVICISCGARGGNVESGVCVVCGADVDEELGSVLDELTAAANVIAALKSRRGHEERL